MITSIGVHHLLDIKQKLWKSPAEAARCAGYMFGNKMLPQKVICICSLELACQHDTDSLMRVAGIEPVSISTVQAHRQIVVLI